MNLTAEAASSHRSLSQLLNKSHFPGNLKGEEGAAERTIEDVFIRKFMFGTFHSCLANEIVIKRRGNMLTVCALVLQKHPPQRFYFLIGYSEYLLSHLYKCPVKLSVQTVQDKVMYKYLWSYSVLRNGKNCFVVVVDESVATKDDWYSWNSTTHSCKVQEIKT